MDNAADPVLNARSSKAMWAGGLVQINFEARPPDDLCRDAHS
ncbi:MULTISPECIES: hypothetical protein [Rhodococcus]|nr:MULTISPECIES: hypothetical protein [Rhodococcus]MDJ0440324.1 hypothetical protein [Rhodococcus qingshengii]